MAYDFGAAIDSEERQRKPSSSRTPATSKEKALWLLEKLVPNSGINNVGIAVQVDGRLRADALQVSIAVMVGRYETLRTVFLAADAELVKELVSADDLKVEIEQLQLSGDQLGKDLSAFVGRPFDLDGRALLRAGIAAHPDGDIFCVAVHHLVFDAISTAIFMRALIPVYDALAADLPVPPQARTPVPPLHEPGPRADGLAYWRENLRGFVPDGLDLWCGSPRAHHPLMSGETVTHALSAEALSAVQRLQREVRAPVATLLLAAYYALLASHGAGPDLVIGSPLDVRGPQLPDAIGYHVNVVPLRLHVDFAEGFRQLARRTRDTFLAAMAHADVSVDDLSAELPRAGSSWQTTLYRHMFNYLPEMASGDFTIDGMAARLLAPENGSSKFDFELFVMPSKTEIRLRARYCSEILARADVEALLRRYEAILIEAGRDADRSVGALAGWSGLDRRVIDMANATARPIEPATVLSAFRARVLAAPQAPAVVDDGHTLVYRQVWAAAVAVRDLLSSSGIGPGDVVAVAGPRGREVIAGALGVWLAGAAYLPLDPEQDAPARRLAHAKAKAVLTGTGVRLPPGDGLPPVLPLTAATAEPAIADEPSEATQVIDPLAPACLIYASGPAGPPAATVLSHQGLANMVSHFAGELAAGPGTGTLALADFSSAGSLLELFLPLSSGGRVVVAPDEARMDASALRTLIERHDVAIVQVPPGSPARVLDEAAAARPGLRIVARAQEIPAALVRRFLAAGCRLHSVYGGAETTGWAMSGCVEGETGLTRGRPIANMRAFVLAPDGRELPIGVRGELCLAGTGVALGPHDERRFPRRDGYGRYCRTGELASWRPDGTVERLGQITRQVIIAGSPVNLSEVDAVLLDHEGVRATVALTVPSAREGDVLVAFAEVARDANLAGPLRGHALASLPPAAVPGHVFCVDALPRDADGQVDHDVLTRLALERLDREPEPGLDAGEPLVRELLVLWRQLLKVDVTPQTVFFAAGGHSLLAAKLAQDVEALTGIHLELPEVFNHPTPSALAARIRAIDAEHK